MKILKPELCFILCLADLKSLIIGNLSEKTTAETLKSAFEGALTARVAVDKETGASKMWVAAR